MKYHIECQEINWDSTFHLMSTYSRIWTIRSEFTNLQHIANNLPDSFTDLKGVTKSFNPARNAPERVEVPIKTTQLPVPKMRGSSTASNQDPACMQATKDIEEKSSKSVNASQPSVENILWVVYTQRKGNHHNPASACTHWLGHRNTRTHAYWEITKSHHGCIRFPQLYRFWRII